MSEQISAEEAVRLLDAIGAGERRDPEAAHGEADDILLQFVPPEVVAAYNRIEDRVGGWWYA